MGLGLKSEEVVCRTLHLVGAGMGPYLTPVRWNLRFQQLFFKTNIIIVVFGFEVNPNLDKITS